MGLVIRKPGMLTTIQDEGRYGYQDSGFSPNGTMDHRAAKIANLLVENSPDTCVLEFALTGPSVRFTTDAVIALTGGNFEPTIDKQPVPMYCALQVKRGSILRLNAPRCGTYGYLAVAGGGFDIEPVMGSYSTNLRCELGGYKGRALMNGDYLPFKTKNIDIFPNLGSHAMEPDRYYEFDKPEVTIRVIPGPQQDMFSERGIMTFFGEPFAITTKSNRMGYRLDGPEIETIGGSDIISEAIVFGAIQVPTGGHPIAMLADRQTTGGYAKIGTIASYDIPKFVQRPPGSIIRFAPITVKEAQNLLRMQAEEYDTLARKVKRLSSDGVSLRRTARRLTPILEEQARRSAGDTLWINFNSEE